MIRRLQAWILGVATLSLVACAGDDYAPHQAGPEVEAAVASLASSLTHPIQIAGEEPQRYTLEERMAYHDVPGVSIAYFREGKIVWAEAWGVEDATGGEPLTTETLLQASSLSKAVTAVGLLTMVDDGLVDLDTDISEYLTSWSLPENEFTIEQPVTPRLIASHAAGLTVPSLPGYVVGEPLPTLLQVLDGVPPAKNAPVMVGSPPGVVARYSGGGYVVLQLLMEQVTETAFPQLMRKRVLAPLGMAHSTFAQPLPADRVAEAASGHDGGGNPLEGRYRIYPETAAAGLWTTPIDLARLAANVERAYSGETGRLLSPSTAKEMLTAQRGGWGIGFGIKRQFGRSAVILNQGCNEGFCADWVTRHDGDGMVIMTNGANGARLIREIHMSAASVYGWTEWASRERSVVELPAEVLQGYAGRYRVQQPIDAEVIVKATERGVNIEVVGRTGARDFFPTGQSEFFDLSGQKARFVPSGEPATAVLFGSIRAERID